MKDLRESQTGRVHTDPIVQNSMAPSEKQSSRLHGKMTDLSLQPSREQFEDSQANLMT